jgi:putative tryptophan/tyrosine transport system substrate-binding protein
MGREGHMRQREFITLLGGAAVWPLAARAQQQRRIGILVGAGNDLQSQSWITRFRQKLQQLGWTDGLQIDIRWGGADIDYIRASAAELVNSKPDVILIYSIRVLNAVREATRAAEQSDELAPSHSIATVEFHYK